MKILARINECLILEVIQLSQSIMMIQTRSSLIYNTSVRHECDKSNTSATLATQVRQECDMSEKF